MADRMSWSNVASLARALETHAKAGSEDEAFIALRELGEVMEGLWCLHVAREHGQPAPRRLDVVGGEGH